MPRRLGHEYCDDCGAESDLYATWPICNDCGGHYCNDCYVPRTFEEDEGRTWCLCYGCRDAQLENEPDDDYNGDDWATETLAEVEDITDVEFD